MSGPNPEITEKMMEIMTFIEMEDHEEVQDIILEITKLSWIDGSNASFRALTSNNE